MRNSTCHLLYKEIGSNGWHFRRLLSLCLFDFDVTQSSEWRTNDLNFYIWFAARSMIFGILNVTLPFGISGAPISDSECLWLLLLQPNRRTNAIYKLNLCDEIECEIVTSCQTQLPSVHTEQMKFVRFASVWIVAVCAHLFYAIPIPFVIYLTYNFQYSTLSSTGKQHIFNGRILRLAEQRMKLKVKTKCKSQICYKFS